MSFDRIVLSIGFAVLIAALAWVAVRKARGLALVRGGKALPETDLLYWGTMLVAGVFGTVLGDYFEHAIGQGVAMIVLTVALIPVLMVYWRSAAPSLFLYWATIGMARTTGTAIGDWLAENDILKIGLPVCTLATGVIFVALLVLWRDRRPAEPATSAA